VVPEADDQVSVLPKPLRSFGIRFHKDIEAMLVAVELNDQPLLRAEDDVGTDRG